MKTMEDLSSLKYAILAYLFYITIVVPSTQHSLFLLCMRFFVYAHINQKFFSIS